MNRTQPSHGLGLVNVPLSTLAMFCWFVLLMATPLTAELRLSALFSEGAVLQHGHAHPVWGWDAVGTRVPVEFAGQLHTPVAGPDGRWQAILEPLAVDHHPKPLVVTSSTGTVTVADILVGEVWLCSGQSNMEYPVRLAPDAAELFAAADLPWLRHFRVRRSDVPEPAGDVTGSWLRSSPTNAVRFTAVGFHFARALHARLGVPVGLVNATWGATRIRNWSPGGGQYNGMVAPLAPFPFRGVLWYQAEGDTGRAAQYRTEFPALIQAWRTHWGTDDLPFLFVQLPNYNVPRDPSGLFWAELRASQAAALSLPATGMVITIDAGLPDEGHPPDKSAIGQRLARLALVDVYQADGGNATGPLAIAATAEGHRLRIRFTHAIGGLAFAGDHADSAFTVAGLDGVFHPAIAHIDGETLVLESASVAAPMSARYAWANNPPVVLYNSEGLPASPFEVHVVENLRTGHHPDKSP
jgi:sialate O-acetylesterase